MDSDYKQPKVFFRYRAFSTDTLTSLCKDELYFSHPGAFNDPLDCSPTLCGNSSNEDLRKLLAFFICKRVASQVQSHLKEARVKENAATEHAEKQALREAEKSLSNIAYLASDSEYGALAEINESKLLLEAIERELHRWYERGVCCFSTSYSSPLLWSHYGDQHKGLCIGYTIDRNPVQKLQKVVYGGNRAIDTSKLCEVFLNESEPSATDIDRDVLLRKARGWKYESEWRLIGQQGLHPSPLLLTEITFGLRCPTSVMHAVIRALEGRDKNLKYYKMYSVRSSFSLRRRRINSAEPLFSLPVTAQSGVEIFGAPDDQIR